MKLCRNADPRPIMSLKSVRVLSVAAGNRYSVCLSDDGRLWSWGSNAWGCLGHGQARDEREPRPIKFNSSDISSGNNSDSSKSCNSMSSENERNSYANASPQQNRQQYQRGQQYQHQHHQQAGIYNNRDTTPVNSASTAPYFIAISAGPKHCLALDRQGHCWSWGYGTDGALGLQDRQHRDTPNKVIIGDVTNHTRPNNSKSNNNSSNNFDNNRHSSYNQSSFTPHHSFVSNHSSSHSFDHKKKHLGSVGNVLSVSAGGRHSLIITKEGKMMSCGNNDHGQLGRQRQATSNNQNLNMSQTTPNNTHNNQTIPITALTTSSALTDHFHHPSSSFRNKNNQNYSQHQHYGSITKPNIELNSMSVNSSSEEEDVFCVFREVEVEEVSNLASSLSRVSFTQNNQYSQQNLYNQHNQNNQYNGQQHSQSHNGHNQHCSQDSGYLNNVISQSSLVKPCDWIVCSAGGCHSLALKRDGSTWSFGSDQYGQLGFGNKPPQGQVEGRGQVQLQGGFNSGVNKGLSRSIRQPFNPIHTSTSQRHDRHVPSRIPALRGQLIENISAGDNHSLFKVKTIKTSSQSHGYSNVNSSYSGSNGSNSGSNGSNGGSNSNGHSNGNSGGEVRHVDSDEVTEVVLACGDGSQGQLGILHDYLSSGDIADQSIPTYVDLIRSRVERSPYSHHASKQHLSTLQIGNSANTDDGTRLRYQ